MKHQIYLILHFACMAVWFGSSITLPGRIRRGLTLGEAEAKFTVNEVARAQRLSIIFGILTFVTGLLLISTIGGFRGLRMSINVGMGLTLAILFLEIVVQRPTWNRIGKIILEGGDRTLIQPLKTRIAMTSGITQLLWLIVLVSMVIKY